MTVNRGDLMALLCAKETEDRIKRLLYSRTSSKDLANDMYQDLCVRVLSLPPDYTVDNGRAWLFRTVRNMVIDYWRCIHPIQESELSDLERSAIDNRTDLQTPERSLDIQQRLATALALVSRLPPKQKEAFTMKRLRNISMGDIAIMGRSTEKAVEKCLVKAYAKIATRQQEILEP